MPKAKQITEKVGYHSPLAVLVSTNENEATKAISLERAIDC